jgi:hypothetical protein
MSNLSELLPTGGGQNAVDFVASGTLSSGVTVALKADGTVTAVATGGPSAGSPVIFQSGSTQNTSVAYDATNNKIVISYRNSSNYGTAVVGTVSGTSISFGTPVVFNSATTLSTSVVYDSTNGKVVIAYRDHGNSQYGTAIVGTVSGTSVSFGSSTVFESAASSWISATFDSTNNKVIIAYQDQGNTQSPTAVVGTVSGTSISFGTPVVFGSSYSNYISATFDSTNGKVVVSYPDAGNSSYGTSLVGTVSGTSISFGTAVVFESANCQYIASTYDSTNNKIVISYQDIGNSNYGTAVVGTVSGTSISFGSAVVFESATTTFTSAVYDSTNNKIVISYSDGGNSSYGTAIVGTVSGTSISFGSAVALNAAEAGNIASAYDSANGKVVTVYRDGGSTDGTSVVFAVTSSNNTDFIGITAEAISDTATGPVNVYGGINEAQTGLTIGSDYYVQNDGSLSTTASSVKAGQAISATTINMMDLT